MKNQEEACANYNAGTKEIGCSLAEKGITGLVKQKEAAAPAGSDLSRHWSGQPGEDLFFNGWMLLF